MGKTEYNIHTHTYIYIIASGVNSRRSSILDLVCEFTFSSISEILTTACAGVMNTHLEVQKCDIRTPRNTTTLRKLHDE